MSLAIIVLAGAVLRLKDLTTASLWRDEFATLAQVRGSFAEMIAATAADTYPPGFNILAWTSVQLFGIADWSLRLPALLLGIAAIPALYWLGTVAYGRIAGLVAALLVALSPFAILHSHDARMYPLLLLGAALSAAATIELVRAPTWPRAVATVAANVVLLHSHPYGFLSWISIGAAVLALLIARPDLRKGFWPIAAAQIASGLAFLPWALILMGVAGRLRDNGFWIDQPNVWDALYALKIVAGGYVLSLLLLILLLVALFNRKRVPGIDKTTSTAILLALAFGPLLIGFVASQLTTPILYPRYLACSVPALLVLAAGGAASLASSTWRLLIVAVTVVFFGAAAIATEPRSFGEDWRGLARYLSANIEDGDCLVTGRGRSRGAMEYYMPELPDCLIVLADTAPMPPVAEGTQRLYAIRATSTDTLEGLDALLDTGWTSSTRRFGSVRLLVFERQ